jgi:hypothetical protein
LLEASEPVKMLYHQLINWVPVQADQPEVLDLPEQGLRLVQDSRLEQGRVDRGSVLG